MKQQYFQNMYIKKKLFKKKGSRYFYRLSCYSCFLSLIIYFQKSKEKKFIKTNEKERGCNI